ncbi:hypothetical protein KH400_16365 [Desertibacillus haloalkaliphilus]|nr:hypothetical protein [Desertibacillus haloalkaliphilus]
MSALKQEVKSLLIEGKFARRKFAEITIGSKGETVYFDCKTKDRTKAIKEVDRFIDCMKKEYGKESTIIWKFRDEDIYYMGTSEDHKKPFATRVKEQFLDFFDLR